MEDIQVGEGAAQRLQLPGEEVRIAKEGVRDEHLLHASRRPIHNVALDGLFGHGDARQDLCAQVDGENLKWRNPHGPAEAEVDDDGPDLREVVGPGSRAFRGTNRLDPSRVGSSRFGYVTPTDLSRVD